MSKLPGSNVLQQLVDGAKAWALAIALLGAFVGAGLWAVASHTHNHHYAARGRMKADSVNALFVSRSVTRAGWYRAVLPAMFSGNDWAAIEGDPPGMSLVSSWIAQGTVEPDLLSYDVVVLEMVRGRKWADLIRRLRSRGVKVVYEIDDYVHGIRHLPDHDFRSYFTKEHVKHTEECMRACDAMIVSTEFLAEKYERVMRDRPIFVCLNGLDMGRYRLTRPDRGRVPGSDRDTITIMWSGATGHQAAMLEWLPAIKDVLRRYPHTSFASIGQDFAALLHDEFPDRVLSVPFSALETYPAAMMLGDVSLAPAGKADWHKAKSQLRAMESAALGIPIVADKHYAESVVDGETGLIVESRHQVAASLAALVEDDERRLEMSRLAREKATAEFSMEHRVTQWFEALTEIV